MTTSEYNNCVDLYSDSIYRFILKQIGDTDKAHDIVQEAFIRLWKKVTTVSYEKAKSYLFTTAYHCLIDHDDMVAQVQMNSNRVKVSQAIWKGLFGRIGIKKTSGEDKQDSDKSSDGVVFWALTSIGVDHINTLTGSDLKLHRKVNEEGEFKGYLISNKEYDKVNVLEDKPK